MPVTVIARQARGIEAQHQAGLAEPDLADQALKSLALSAGGSRLSQVIVDDRNALPWPAEGDGPIDQVILEFCAFLMLAHLAGGGLADVDVRQLGLMRCSYPFSA